MNSVTKKRSDLHLASSPKNSLDGIYSNSHIDTNRLSENTVWHILNNKTTANGDLQNAKIKIEALTNKKILISLMSDQTVKEKLLLRGKFKNGYFSLKNRYRARTSIGPLIWALSGLKIHLGITQDKNLIIFESTAGSTMILLLPIFVAGHVQIFEYKRV